MTAPQEAPRSRADGTVTMCLRPDEASLIETVRREQQKRDTENTDAPTDDLRLIAPERLAALRAWHAPPVNPGPCPSCGTGRSILRHDPNNGIVWWCPMALDRAHMAAAWVEIWAPNVTVPDLLAHIEAMETDR